MPKRKISIEKKYKIYVNADGLEMKEIIPKISSFKAIQIKEEGKLFKCRGTNPFYPQLGIYEMGGTGGEKGDYLCQDKKDNLFILPYADFHKYFTVAEKEKEKK